MKNIFLVGGKAQHGKDTFAVYGEEFFKSYYNRVLIIHYADYLKFICSTYLGWNGKKDDVGRSMLQNIGTEVVRHRQPNFWVDTIINFISLFDKDFDYFIIPDCRFPDEIERMKEVYKTSVVSIKIIRHNFENGLTSEQRNHPSETALGGYKFDYTIDNDGDKDRLKRTTRLLLRKYL